MESPSIHQPTFLRRVQDHVVLCIDDDPATLAALRRALGREPYDLVVTDDVRWALAFVDRWPVDLVISDQEMPEMRGSQLLEEISWRSPKTALCLMTGYPHRLDRPTGRGRSVPRTFLKPWEDRDLKAAIRQVLGLRSRVSRRGRGGEAAGDERELPSPGTKPFSGNREGRRREKPS